MACQNKVIHCSTSLHKQIDVLAICDIVNRLDQCPTFRSNDKGKKNGRVGLNENKSRQAPNTCYHTER